MKDITEVLQDLIDTLEGQKNQDLHYRDIDPISTSEAEEKYVPLKCECGSDKVKSPIHSDYCPKYKR